MPTPWIRLGKEWVMASVNPAIGEPKVERKQDGTPRSAVVELVPTAGQRAKIGSHVYEVSPGGEWACAALGDVRRSFDAGNFESGALVVILEQGE